MVGMYRRFCLRVRKYLQAGTLILPRYQAILIFGGPIGFFIRQDYEQRKEFSRASNPPPQLSVRYSPTIWDEVPFGRICEIEAREFGRWRREGPEKGWQTAANLLKYRIEKALDEVEKECLVEKGGEASRRKFVLGRVEFALREEYEIWWEAQVMKGIPKEEIIWRFKQKFREARDKARREAEAEWEVLEKDKAGQRSEGSKEGKGEKSAPLWHVKEFF